MRPFQYERARTLGDAARLVAGADAMAIAGGTNLLDLMKLQVETPGQLADVNRVGFAEIEDTDDGGLRIGALATALDDVAAGAQRHVPRLTVAHRQTVQVAAVLGRQT